MSNDNPAPLSVDRNTTALALSGGGFRATLFHCGALMRLNELGLLSTVTRISSVSGGSITSGMLAVKFASLTNQNGVFTDLVEKVVAPLREFCSRSIDTAAVGWGAIIPGKSVGDYLIDAYDDLFGGQTLGKLPHLPQFVFNATNLQTGRLVRFRHDKLREWSIGETESSNIPLSVAVAASSAFPPVLSPVTLDMSKAVWTPLAGAVHHGDPTYTETLSLTDGGAYDNLGLETVDTFKTVIVSDAGAPFGTEETSSAFWPKQAMRALDIATDQARALRKRLLFSECTATGRTPVYCGIDSTPSTYAATQALQPKPDLIKNLARMRTRLNPFSEVEQCQLINWGWLMMDVAARTYVLPGLPAPTDYPIKNHPL